MNDKRQMKSAARLFAVQALFQMEASGSGLKDVQSEFETHRLGAEIDGETYAEGNLDLFRAPQGGVRCVQSLIDNLPKSLKSAKKSNGR